MLPEKGAGLFIFNGPTGGYLVGFIFTAFFAGMIKVKNDQSLYLLFIKFSVSFTYIFGLFGLWNYMGWDKPF